MAIISQVASGMQTVLTTVSDTVAKTTGFIKRQRKLTGSRFVRTLVFGWLANPKSTYEELAQTATTVGVTLTPQAIEQRTSDTVVIPFRLNNGAYGVLYPTPLEVAFFKSQEMEREFCVW